MLKLLVVEDFHIILDQLERVFNNVNSSMSLKMGLQVISKEVTYVSGDELQKQKMVVRVAVSLIRESRQTFNYSFKLELTYILAEFPVRR
jgi:hypothetical protein